MILEISLVHHLSETKDGKRLQMFWMRASVPGTFLVECYADSLPAPVATVYFRFIRSGHQIDILSSNVNTAFRRQGIRSAMNDTLRHWYDDKHIVSDSATDDGKKFMKAYGYRQLKDKTWFFQARKKKGKKNEPI